VPKEGDFLVSGVGTLGISYQVKVSDKFYFKDGNVIWFKLEGDLLSSYFKYCFESEHIQKQIIGQTSKSTVGTYTITNAKKTEFWYTKNPKEQQKIASCLSSLDELIATHNDKLGALKDHKKGLMQKLFPQEGQKVPDYRFPEFKNDEEWNKMELGDLVSIKGRIGYRGYTKDDIVAQGNGAISMSPSNISDNGSLSFEKSTYITWDKYYESPEIMLEDGFTVLVKTGSTFGKVAHISNLKEKTTINPQLVVLKPNEIDKYFLYLIVSNTSVQKQIVATVVGGAIPTLSQDSISKFEVMVPREKEQQKIASCLLALDELISILSNRIEELQQHKKGLMQGLFPKIEN
jgi:type I restriction enzyme S subunit